jgi:hydrogenase expression/formation protein HypD
MKLRKEFESLDAESRFGIQVLPGRPVKACKCGEVLKGKMPPKDCPLFAKACTPLTPVGPCMVSSEGSCAAAYKYSR